MDPIDNNPIKITSKELFFAFAWLSLSGFGGVMPWVYGTVVEKKKWMGPQEFAEQLAIAQILPGANVTNFASMLGYRFAGWRGAVAAIGGLLFFPFFIIIALGILYQHYGNFPMVQGALRGVLAVAAGLVLSTGFKLASGQKKLLRSLIFGLSAIFGVAIMGWPLPLVVAVTGITALIIEWRAYE